MRRSIAYALLATALTAVSITVSVSADDGGGWKAAKRRSETTPDASLAYRPSTESEPVAVPPKVERTGEVQQTQFEQPAETRTAVARPKRTAAQPPVRRTATRPTANAQPETSAPLEAFGAVARARNAKGQAGYVLLDDAGDPQYILAAHRRYDLAQFVGRHVRVRGAAVAGPSGRVPRLSIDSLAVRQGNSNAAASEVRPVTLLQVPQNAEEEAAQVKSNPQLVTGQEEIPEPVAPIAEPSEDVPPPRVKRVQVSPRAAAAQPMPEVIHPGEGSIDNPVDGEVYYAPNGPDGEFDGDAEIVVEGPPMQQPMYGPYGRPYPRGPIRGLLSRIDGAWVRADYLLWSTEGMNVPPLVTTSPTGTPRSMAGVLGEEGTSVLFGDSTIFEDSRSGGRIRGGIWWDPCHIFGMEGEYLALEDATETFSASSAGDPILARPFFDPLAGQETAELVAFPGLISGQVDVEAMTQFNSAGFRLRLNAANQTFCEPCGGGVCDNNFLANEFRSSGLPGTDHDFNQSSYRLDLLGGYRYLRLDDHLQITERLDSLDTTTPGTFDISDSFDTENRFNGGEIGLLFEVQRRRWSIELLTKIALGTTQQVVTINGQTTSDEGGDVVTEPGGLLAQRTNMGTFEANQFSVVPELGVTLGYQLTQHTRLTVGYTLIYWSGVARAGDQIDLDVNPNLLPPETVPFTGPARPEFNLVESDFWAQGLNAGVDIRW